MTPEIDIFSVLIVQQISQSSLGGISTRRRRILFQILVKTTLAIARTALKGTL